MFQRLLGPVWEHLPPALRAGHRGRVDLAGTATVERGRSWPARLVAAAFGFPEAGSEVAAEVAIEPDGSGERWVRHIGGRRFASTMRPGRGAFEYLPVERFGPFALTLALVWAEGRLALVVRHWCFLGLRLPSALAPGGAAGESSPDGLFHFDVEIRLPLAGRVVRYQGRLVPLESGADPRCPPGRSRLPLPAATSAA